MVIDGEYVGTTGKRKEKQALVVAVPPVPSIAVDNRLTLMRLRVSTVTQLMRITCPFRQLPLASKLSIGWSSTRRGGWSWTSKHDVKLNHWLTLQVVSLHRCISESGWTDYLGLISTNLACQALKQGP